MSCSICGRKNRTERSGCEREVVFTRAKLVLLVICCSLGYRSGQIFLILRGHVLRQGRGWRGLFFCSVTLEF